MLGDRIKRARKKIGLTQEDIANKIGVKRSVISKYENGLIEPSISQLKKIADALDVPWYELYSDSSQGQIASINDAITREVQSGDAKSEDQFTLLFTNPVIQDLAKRVVELEEELRRQFYEDMEEEYKAPDASKLKIKVDMCAAYAILHRGILPTGPKPLIKAGMSRSLAWDVMNYDKKTAFAKYVSTPEQMDNYREIFLSLDDEIEKSEEE